MRRVLMVSPHFPPDSSAASHRVRLLAPHLPAAGWTPTVVTVDRSAYEGRLDADLADLVPADVDVVRAPAWRASATRRIGLGDLGLRALSGLRRACRSALARERFDALFITLYPVYPALLGPRLKREFHVPFVLDYQDPWVGSWGLTVGGRRDGGADWKSRASRRLGTWLEPRVVAAADALTAVSQGTIDGIVERLPSAARLPQAVIPVGFEPADFDALRARRRASRFDAADGLVHLVYVGTLLPTGVRTLELLCRGLARARAVDPAAARIRLHAFGTSNQTTADRCRLMPVAEAAGIADVVSEVPGRLDYLDALSTLVDASAVLLLGNAEPHYTASKLYPALLAQRPVLAIFHQSSSVVSILRDVAAEPTVRIVTYGNDDIVTQERVEMVACHLRALAARCAYDARDVNLSRAGAFSAAALAGRLAGLFDRIAA
jgi:hypothetical protein